MWTNFFDMASGGQEKLRFSQIWIEADEKEACSLFEIMFCVNPKSIECECCGEDYAITEMENVPSHSVGYKISLTDIKNFFEYGFLPVYNI